MKLTATNIIIGAAIIGVGYLIYRKYIEKKQLTGGQQQQPGSATGGSTAGTTGSTAAPTPVTAPNIDFNLLLKHSSSGEEVKTLQRYLNKTLQVTEGSGLFGNLQQTPLTVDGNFGDLTLTALQNKAGKTQTTLKELNIIDYLGNVNRNSQTASNSNVVYSASGTAYPLVNAPNPINNPDPFGLFGFFGN